MTYLEAFLGFLVKTNMKAYTKLNVAMCYQRHLAVISAGDGCRGRPPDKIRNKIFFNTMLLDNVGKEFSISIDIKYFG